VERPGHEQRDHVVVAETIEASQGIGLAVKLFGIIIYQLLSGEAVVGFDPQEASANELDLRRKKNLLI
jgi:hypothetical protein